MDQQELDNAIDLGAWTGRKQAFAGLAARCTAADAICLRELRDGKKHRAANLTWDEFCPRYLGISRALADRTIRLLEEFGTPYFYLAGLVQIAPEDYRRIAGAVSESGVQLGPECIAFEPGNTARLAEAVESLKRAALPALPAPEKAAKDPLRPAVRQLHVAVKRLEQLLAEGPGDHDRGQLLTALDASIERLSRLGWHVRIGV